MAPRRAPSEWVVRWGLEKGEGAREHWSWLLGVWPRARYGDPGRGAGSERQGGADSSGQGCQDTAGQSLPYRLAWLVCGWLGLAQ